MSHDKVTNLIDQENASFPTPKQRFQISTSFYERIDTVREMKGLITNNGLMRNLTSNFTME